MSGKSSCGRWRATAQLHPAQAGGTADTLPHMVEPAAGPAEHPHQMGEERPGERKFIWDFSVIKDLLMNPVYAGAIASQKKDYRFKLGTIREKKPQDWIVVEQRHERSLTAGALTLCRVSCNPASGPAQNGETSLFAGLIKCGECGKSLTIRTTHAKHPQQIYACKTYGAFGKNHCTQHRVEYSTLYRLVLNKIRECARAALMDGEAVAGKLTDTCEAEQRASGRRWNAPCQRHGAHGRAGKDDAAAVRGHDGRADQRGQLQPHAGKDAEGAGRGQGAGGGRKEEAVR